MDKKDELVYSILHAAIFRLICSKLLCKSTILNPSFEKFSGGRGPPDPPQFTSAIRASLQARPFGPRANIGPSGHIKIGEKNDLL